MDIKRARARRPIQNVKKTETTIWPRGSTWHNRGRSLDGNEIGDILPTPELRDARFMRSLLAASDYCIKVIDLDGKLSFMSEGGQRVMEVSDFNAIKGCPWPHFWADQGNAKAKFAIEEARAGCSYRFEGAPDTAAGKPRFWYAQFASLTRVKRSDKQAMPPPMPRNRPPTPTACRGQTRYRRAHRGLHPSCGGARQRHASRVPAG